MSEQSMIEAFYEEMLGKHQLRKDHHYHLEIPDGGDGWLLIWHTNPITKVAVEAGENCFHRYFDKNK
ncbi:hypothetical protein IC235_18435 [Hymenobacter sp. BT664]|uniref:Uncharacterized protein n=1 Tax=Hymenobacter montanus TaxID=2771359 RepID=A0A927GKS6_9BACT|nr:hypothetical protein [Hymenobacter montanus]MBD2769872.1 hypothetical protein [Hymenobacter montanus]